MKHKQSYIKTINRRLIMNINDITKTELYNNAFYLAVEYAGDFEYVSQMKASLYDYIFAFDNNFDTEAEHNMMKGAFATVKSDYKHSSKDHHSREDDDVNKTSPMADRGPIKRKSK